jgi:hypothetical protein
MRRPTFPIISLLVLSFLTATDSAGGSEKIDMARDKTWVHEPTGFRFPPDLGTFTRLGGTRFDEDGRNVSVMYGDRALRLMVSAYVYPDTAGVSLANHFEQVKRELRKVNPKAEVLADGKWTLQQGGRKFSGRRAAFSSELRTRGGEVLNLVEEVYLLLQGDQFIKFRVTCPQDKYEASAERVERFLKALTLPELEPAAVPKK